MAVTNATLPYLRQAKDGCVVVFGSRSAWRPEVTVSGITYTPVTRMTLVLHDC